VCVGDGGTDSQQSVTSIRVVRPRAFYLLQYFLFPPPAVHGIFVVDYARVISAFCCMCWLLLKSGDDVREESQEKSLRECCQYKTVSLAHCRLGKACGIHRHTAWNLYNIVAERENGETISY
jgi:hypothetical protein